MEFTVKDINDYDIEVNSKRFLEFCDLLDEMDNYLYEDAYLMEVVVNNNNQGDTVKQALRKNYDDTVSTTKTAFGAANKIAKSLGKLYRTLYNLAMKCIHFIASTISFILDAITAIPRSINRCLDKLKYVKDSVMSKIRGNIMLYLTHKDIADLYTSNFMNYLLQFKSIAEMLQQDEVWLLTQKTFWAKGENKYQTMFGYSQAKRDKVASSKIIGNPNAVKNKGIIPSLEDLSTKLKRITFTKSEVDMSLPGNRSIYFKKPENTSNNLIKIIYKGQTTTYSYYLDAVERLSKDLNEISGELKNLESVIGNKISDVAYKNFAELPEKSQRNISKILVYITNVSKTTGNLIRYIQSDIATINNTIDKIIKSQGNG